MEEKLPRGLRNNNPGNLIKSRDWFLGEKRPSTDNRFKQFYAMSYGYRAMFITLDTYRKNGFDTIEKILKKYAPNVENDTEVYIRRVELATGIGRNEKLFYWKGHEYIKIVAAMSQVENGVPAIMEDVLAGFEMQDRIIRRG